MGWCGTLVLSVRMSRALLGVTFIATGLLHFCAPRMYEAIMPRYLPAHRELVYASGVAEIAGGVGVLHPRTRRARGLVADRHAGRDLPRQRRDGHATPSASSSSRRPPCGPDCRSRAS